MIFERKQYLDKLILKKHNGLIKIVTGVRRCGKSFLLFNLFRRHLISEGVRESNIIEIALDDRANKGLRDPDNLLVYVKGKIKNKKTYYLILDEVQYVDEFEDVLNSFLHIGNLDVYVTGSNSKFLSSDIITEFRGRGDELRLNPLTFSEFMGWYNGDKSDGWNEYMLYGGLPLVVLLPTAEQKVEMLKNLFRETYINDIIGRYRIKHKEDFEELINVLASAVGSMTNAKKLSDTFKSKKGRVISLNTLKNYLDYLCDAFIINSAHRYDIKGKRYINSPLKYYFTDIGLRNARINFRQTEENHMMENIISGNRTNFCPVELDKFYNTLNTNSL